MMRRSRWERIKIAIRFLIVDAIKFAWDPHNEEYRDELYWDLDRVGWYLEFEED